MAEYIERQAAKDAFGRMDTVIGKTTSMVIDSVPAADVAPVAHGHVITKNRPTTYYTLHFVGTRENAEPIYTIEKKELECNPVDYCSVCGRRLCSRFTNYCPNCGAKMDKEADDAQ